MAVVDVADFQVLSRLKWYRHETLAGRVYASTQIDGCTVLMHRLILRAPPDQQVDHDDNDGLNNRRSNLRLCTPALNAANRKHRAGAMHPFKGIKRRKRVSGFVWEAVIKVAGKERHLGTHTTAEAAARAYDAAAIRHFGEFARGNFITRSALSG